MFKKSLSASLKTIFDFDKVDYSTPGDAMEQEGLFVRIESARCKVIDKREIAKVTGEIIVFANLDKLPYGYFSKCIAKADASIIKPLFFYSIEENRGTFRNICQRSASFIYFYDSEYDPSLGIIEEIELSYLESE